MSKIFKYFLSVFLMVFSFGFLNLNSVISPESERDFAVSVKEMLLQETENLNQFLEVNKKLTSEFEMWLQENIAKKISPLIAACREKNGKNFEEIDLEVPFTVAGVDARRKLALSFGDNEKELNDRIVSLNQIIEMSNPYWFIEAKGNQGLSQSKQDLDKENQKFLQNCVLIGGPVLGVALIATFLAFVFFRCK